jgi:alpha-methylacyl-CoA racemase
VLAAVIEARTSGRGQVVDAAMVDGVVNLMSAFQAFAQRGLWTDGRGENLVDGGAPYYGTYAARDGKFVSVGAMEPAVLRRAAGAAGPGPGDAARAERPQRLAGAAASASPRCFGTRDRDDWCVPPQGRDACIAPVLTTRRVAAASAARGARQLHALRRGAAPEPRAALLRARRARCAGRRRRRASTPPRSCANGVSLKIPKHIVR